MYYSSAFLFIKQFMFNKFESYCSYASKTVQLKVQKLIQKNLKLFPIKGQ